MSDHCIYSILLCWNIKTSTFRLDFIGKTSNVMCTAYQGTIATARCINLISLWIVCNKSLQRNRNLNKKILEKRNAITNKNEYLLQYVAVYSRNWDFSFKIFILRFLYVVMNVLINIMIWIWPTHTNTYFENTDKNIKI